MNSHSYGTITVRERRDGLITVTLPRSPRRDYVLRSGDLVHIAPRKAAGFFLRFYRRRRAGGWWRLMVGGAKRPAQHPQ